LCLPGHEILQKQVKSNQVNVFVEHSHRKCSHN
jgi:hypothetical protein